MPESEPQFISLKHCFCKILDHWKTPESFGFQSSFYIDSISLLTNTDSQRAGSKDENSLTEQDDINVANMLAAHMSHAFTFVSCFIHALFDDYTVCLHSCHSCHASAGRFPPHLLQISAWNGRVKMASLSCLVFSFDQGIKVSPRYPLQCISISSMDAPSVGVIERQN